MPSLTEAHYPRETTFSCSRWSSCRRHSDFGCRWQTLRGALRAGPAAGWACHRGSDPVRRRSHGRTTVLRGWRLEPAARDNAARGWHFGGDAPDDGARYLRDGDFCRRFSPRRPALVEARPPSMFWTFLLSVWAALNAVFLGGDLFNLYVALELLTFGAVPLVCLDGRAETVAAALRYLLFALAGSVLYLLGAALLYGAYGTLDIALLSGVIRPEPVVWTAVALMTAGLLAKTALFPLHLWLPPAHAGAAAPASAILSALVVKGSFFLIVRIWFDVMPGLQSAAAAQILGAMGAAAIVFGSVLALRAGSIEAADRLFDRRADRLPVPDVPARHRWRHGPIVERNGLDRGMDRLFSHAFAKDRPHRSARPPRRSSRARSSWSARSAPFRSSSGRSAQLWPGR